MGRRPPRIGVRPAMHHLLGALLLAVPQMTGCGQDLYVGSDVLWTAQFESGNFTEWMSVGGVVDASSAATIDVTSERSRGGRFAARLGVTTAVAGVQEGSSLARVGGLPVEAFYSAWYFLPAPVSVGTFWVIMKFRTRRVADDPTTSSELYDLNLKTLPNGDMTLRVYAHRPTPGGDVPLDTPVLVVPVGRWFQIEAFYRSAADSTGRLTFWLDGQEVVDIAGKPSGLSPWVGWEVCSIARDLAPIHADLFVDDVAITTRTPAGPEGTLTR